MEKKRLHDKIARKLLEKHFSGKSFKENSESAKPSLSTNEIDEIVHGSNDWEHYGGSRANFNDPYFVEEINGILEELQSEGFVKLIKEKEGDSLYKRVYLEKEKVSEICYEVGYISRTETERQIEDILLKYKDMPVISQFVEGQLALLHAHKKVKYAENKGKSNIKRLDDILKGATAILSQTEEIYQRNLSMELYGDSKVLEGLLEPICKILTECLDDEFFQSAEKPKEILKTFNVIPNPSYIYLCGKADIKLQHGDQYTLKGSSIGFPSSSIKEIASMTIEDKKIYTIENLTTFHSEELDGFKIYLGGYHNQVRSEFLKIIYDQNPDKEYLHYGDIDSGGIYIYRKLKKDTKIPFRPFRMDVESIKKKKDSWKPLMKNDIVRLQSILKNEEMEEFHKLIAYMLEHNCKLEQESFH